MTYSEQAVDDANSSKSFRMILTVITAASLILTLIGVFGNQIIGFAARKKEYAMLHSCACSRAKIIRMILVENACLFGISILLSAILAIPVSLLIARIFRIANMGIYVDARFDTLLACVIVLWVVTMLTTLSPIRQLIKMNTAMEMKYE